MSEENIIKNKIAVVEWYDSSAVRGWQGRDFKTETYEELLCKSVGIIHEDTEDFITITTSLSHFGNVMDPLTIPKVAIKTYWDFEL